MKVLKSIFSRLTKPGFAVIFIFFLFFSFFFLFLTPNVNKPVSAASCSVSPSSIAQGGKMTIDANGFGAGPLPVRMIGVLSLNTTDLAILNADPFSVTITIDPGQPLGNYRVYVDAGGFGKVYCSPDPISITPAGPVVFKNCTYSGPNPANVGDKAKITYQGFSAGDQIGFWDGFGGTLLQDFGKTANSLSGSVSLDVTLVTPGTGAVMVQSGGVNTKCSDLIVNSGGKITICGYTFPSSVEAGTSVPVSISGEPGDEFQAGFVDLSDSPVGSSVKGIMPASGPLNLTSTAPATPGKYKLLASNLTQGFLCISNNAGNSIEIQVVNVGAGIFGSCSTPAKGLGDSINVMNYCFIEKDIFDDKAFVWNQFAGLIDVIYNFLSGESMIHPETNHITQGGGVLAVSGKMVASLYSAPPASGVQYLAGKIRDFNPVKPAYAQSNDGGIGFGALAPVQKIWTVFRNFSYVGFVLVFVIIGFMIMFRAHISPQAVATVQDSIPRIVIALILVTFSYAIAGLFIDVMFLFLNIVINSLETTGLLKSDGGNFVFEKSVFGVVWGDWKSIVGSVFNSINDVIGEVISLPKGLDWAIGFFAGGLVAIIFGIALLFIMFRIFIMLLMAYVMIIMLTIAAPFYFLFQALPGNNGAKEWFKQMASNVAVFPTVALMFILAGIIGGLEAFGATSSAGIGAGQVGQFPLLAGGIKTETIGSLIGFGILLMTPQAAEIIKNAFGIRGGPNFGAGAAALGAGAGVLGAGGRQLKESPFGRGIREMNEQVSRNIGTGFLQRLPYGRRVLAGRPGGGIREKNV